MTWTEIPNRIKNAMRDRVNHQLQLEGIPPVGEELMLTRMEMALMSAKIMKNRRKVVDEQSNDAPAVMPQVHKAFLKQGVAEESMSVVRKERVSRDTNAAGVNALKRSGEL
jgi:hypothetical protein